MLDMRAAVRQVLSEQGGAVLSAPARFVGSVSDLVDTDSPEMTVLYNCCDAGYLACFSEALGQGSPGALRTACIKAAERLTQGYAIDETVARKVSRQIALGVADSAGIAVPPELIEQAPMPKGDEGPAEGRAAPVSTASLPAISAPPAPSEPGIPSAPTPGWSQSTMVGYGAPAPSQPPVEVSPPPRKGLPTGAIVALVIALLVGAAGIVVYVRPDLMDTIMGQQAQALRRYTIKASVDIPGYDEQGSRIPVHVAGTTTTGESLDEHAFLDSQGYGLELPSGSYKVTLDSSPIAADGTIYYADDITMTIDVPDAKELEDSGIDAGAGDVELVVDDTAVLILEPVPADQITQEMIDDIAEWLSRDDKDSDRIGELIELLKKHYAEYQKKVEEERKAEEERQRQAEEKRKADEERQRLEDEKRKAEEEAARQALQSAISSLDGYWTTVNSFDPRTGEVGFVVEIRGGKVTQYTPDGSSDRGEITEGYHVDDPEFFDGSSGWVLSQWNWYLNDGEPDRIYAIDSSYQWVTISGSQGLQRLGNLPSWMG